jgi:hypothetical protein
MDHPMWPTVVDGIVASQAGRTEEAVRGLTTAWNQCGESDHAMRCVVAHFLADLQEDVRAELDWDQRALAAHVHVQDEDLAPLGVPSARAFLPSLHLNLGDGWFRAGDQEQAERHLQEARAAMDELGDDSYGAMIRSGIARLASRLGAESACGRDGSPRP